MAEWLLYHIGSPKVRLLLRLNKTCPSQIEAMTSVSSVRRAKRKKKETRNERGKNVEKISKLVKESFWCQKIISQLSSCSGKETRNAPPAASSKAIGVICKHRQKTIQGRFYGAPSKLFFVLKNLRGLLLLRLLTWDALSFNINYFYATLIAFQVLGTRWGWLARSYFHSRSWFLFVSCTPFGWSRPGC